MSLTAPQLAKHWRRWSAVAAANDWVMEKHRLDLGPTGAGRTRDLSIWHKLVWKCATDLALQAHGAVTADDLRHACYMVATTQVPGWGKRVTPAASIKDLDNRMFSRLLCLWGDEKKMAGLLIDLDCIQSNIMWDHPERAASEGLDVTLARLAPEPKLAAICLNAFGTRDWKSLDAGQKRWLLGIVRDKQRAWNKPVAVTSEPEPVTSEPVTSNQCSESNENPF